MSSEIAIQVTALCKNYGSLKALKNLYLEVFKGEIFGFLGHNGAGKTTFLKILVGLSHASSGEVKIFGEKLSNKTRKNFSFLPERVSIPAFLTPIEFLKYSYRLHYHLPKKVDLEIQEAIEKVGLEKFKKEKVAGFSKGMLQRLGLAQSLLGKPNILLLDEPGSGLDPQGIIDFRNIILEENRTRKATIFLNSHRLLEMEKICHRIGILQNGELVASGSLEDLTKEKNQIHIKLENINEKLIKLFEESSHYFHFINDTEVVLEPKENILVRELPKRIVENDGNILFYSKKKESLEEIFLRITRGEHD